MDQSLAKQQYEIYKSAKIGDQIKIYLDNDAISLYPSKLNPFTPTCIGTIIASQITRVEYFFDNKTHSLSERFIIGWKNEDKSPIRSYARTRDYDNNINNIKDYSRMYIWYPSDMYVKEIIGKSISIQNKIQGYHCKKCVSYVHHSEPNQSDGSFVCWSCRKYPHYGTVIK